MPGTFGAACYDPAVRGSEMRAAAVACSLASLCLGSGCGGEPDVVAVRQAVPLPPELLPLSGDLEMHDPSAIRDGDQNWIFGSGSGVTVRTSQELRAIELVGNAFEGLPAWVADEVPAATSFWSPDVASFGGRFHMYYAVSSKGSSDSCIGHATADALGALGAWHDEGAIICSGANDDWNAIDPSVLVDDDGEVWLVLGSYRTGLKLIAIDSSSGRRAGSEFIPLAERPGMGMIQAPALARHGTFYYLFASLDECCLGADSTHHIVVGRATDVRGPYRDRSGVDMLDGGGTLLLESDDRWRGPGSNDVLTVGDRTYDLYRAYDAEDDGKPTLRISTLVWDELGWPSSAGP